MSWITRRFFGPATIGAAAAGATSLVSQAQAQGTVGVQGLCNARKGPVGKSGRAGTAEAICQPGPGRSDRGEAFPRPDL